MEQQKREVKEERNMSMTTSDSPLALSELTSFKADLSDALARIMMHQDAIVSLQHHVNNIEAMQIASAGADANSVFKGQGHQAVCSTSCMDGLHKFCSSHALAYACVQFLL
jgi:hypothetical protein